MKKNKEFLKDGGKKMIKNKDRLFVQMFCIIAALITWLFVVDEVNPIIIKDVAAIPIEIKNENSLEEVGLVFAGIDIGEIRVQVEGFRNDILNINRNDINVYIDVKGYKEGLNKIPVEIELPDGFTLLDYSPKQVLCDLEAVMNKTVDLTIEIDGRQAAGYYVGNPISSVNSVIVRGPRSVLNSVDKAVALFSINDANETLDKRIPIDIYSDKGLELDLKINPSIAEITVPIYPTKRLEIQVPITGEIEEGYEIKSIKVEPQSLLVAGEKNIISSMEYLFAEPINVEEKTTTIYESINIIGGNYILTENITPIVTIEIEKITSKSFKYEIDEIIFENVPEGYKVEIAQNIENITMNITGLTSFIDEISKEDITVIFDLIELESIEGFVEIGYKTEKNVKEIVFDISGLNIRLLESSNSEE
jgi:YbbR domain-containing protein